MNHDIFFVRETVVAMNEADVYRTAKLLIDQYGADATAQAARRADAMLERGDLNGIAIWKRIIRAIADIRATAGGTKH